MVLLLRVGGRTDKEASLNTVWRTGMETVTVKSLENLQQVVVTANHTFIADEPGGDGDGLGPNPYELLLAALGT